MARYETRGEFLRSARIGKPPDTLPPALPLPADKKGRFKDGYDVLVVIEVKRHKVRASLAVSSGGELVIPDWIRLLIPALVKDQKDAEEVNFYLCTRPIWLVEGEQDAVAQLVANRLQARPLWNRLSEDERREVALRWLSEEQGRPRARETRLSTHRDEPSMTPELEFALEQLRAAREELVATVRAEFLEGRDV